MSRLDEYQRKRDFKRTPEPSGSVMRASAGTRRFVIQKHEARRLHYDLRLENAGVFESWAVPRGLATRPGTKRLAVKVEDHPLDYGDFEGTIPAGEYGGGTVMLWDRGEWRELARKDGRLDFELHGKKLCGKWTLTRMKSDGRDDQWLVIKRRDSSPSRPVSQGHPVDLSVATGRSMQEIAAGAPGRQANISELSDVLSDIDQARRTKIPAEIKPQLATLASEVPRGDDWLYELKFDGYRLLARLEGGQVALLTRNGHDWADRFPEISDALSRLDIGDAVFDGEIVAFQRDGTTSFRLLQAALSEQSTSSLVYQVFDLLYLQGHDLRNAPLVVRKELLEKLFVALSLPKDASLRYTGDLVADGRRLYGEACRLGLEGVICKARDKPYRAGRNRHWLKIKCSRMDEFVIGGYTAPSGSRTGFGSLLLGEFDDDRLIYRGRVGSGFKHRQLERLHTRLERLKTDGPAFDPVPGLAGATWVEPVLVADVEYSERTRDGRLRHPVFRGLRDDRDAKEIRVNDTVRSKRRKNRQSGKRSASENDNSELVAGVRLSSPTRVVYPVQGLTKLALASYYEAVAATMLPWVERRPLSLVRCPEGRGGECFYQKHPRESLARKVPRIEIPEKNGGKATYLYVSDEQDLVRLVQAGVLELHCWGARIDDIERPDMLVFDLDPGPGVAWSDVIHTARGLRDRLSRLELAAFVRTTGGKGLHVVVPLVPSADWDQARAFCRALAKSQASDDPDLLTANMSKAKREGRIFIDYLRNGRGATAIASYSTRAREGATVAVPVRWDELSAKLTSDRYRVDNLRRRLAALGSDPWEGFEAARRPLTHALSSEAAKEDRNE